MDFIYPLIYRLLFRDYLSFHFLPFFFEEAAVVQAGQNHFPFGVEVIPTHS